MDVKKAIKEIEKEYLSGESKIPTKINKKLDRVITIVKKIDRVDDSGKNTIELVSERLRFNVHNLLLSIREGLSNKATLDNFEKETGMAVIRREKLNLIEGKAKSFDGIEKENGRLKEKLEAAKKTRQRDKEYIEKLENEFVEIKKVPVIPKFVADFYERNKVDHIQVLFEISKAYNEEPRNVDKWLDEEENEKTLIQVFLYGKYEIREEDKFVVVLPQDNYLFIRYEDFKDHDFSRLKDVKPFSFLQYIFTENEIKSIDSRYLEFKRKVTPQEERGE